MTDSATPASTPDAPEPAAKPPTILERFAAFKAGHPEAREYPVPSELEARLILAEVIPTLRLLQKDVTSAVDRLTLSKRCNLYQTAIVHGRCLELLRKQTRADQLYLSGIKITAAKRWS